MSIDSCIRHLVPKPRHAHILVPREHVIAVDPSSSLTDLHNLGGDLMALGLRGSPGTTTHSLHAPLYHEVQVGKGLVQGVW